jgi:hypothetical protein
MYKTIEEGLEAFKKALRHHFYFTIVIGEKKENGFLDAEVQQLEGMITALGLSRDEVGRILKPISDELWETKERTELLIKSQAGQQL